ncbi:MAG: NHL repeat-containing protein [Candidatus Tectomicrobia bacterium]|uniref:NHL repeat-containing protein n=1 Tax=Tectimicrobiota bacterium TaxID=2528274 RepID=A0A932CPZ8_UNCTE|nr:NHL repeat-containing protein [Candidatus Tectomicrobia bacterium]
MGRISNHDQPWRIVGLFVLSLWVLAGRVGAGEPVEYLASIAGGPKEAFSFPTALFLDPAKGWLYVADAGANCLFSFDEQLKYLARFDHEGKLRTPTSLVKDPEGRFYVVEKSKGEVTYFDLKSKSARSLLLKGVEFPGPLALGSKGEVYLSDRSNGKIFSVNGNGEAVPRLAAMDGASSFTDLWPGPEGEIYAVDALARKVYRLGGQGDGRTPLSFGQEGGGRGEFLFPVSLTGMGRQLLVADSHRHKILAFDLSGRFLFEFGREGMGEGMLKYPICVRADGQGRIFVLNKGTRRIEVFKLP